MHKVSNRMLKVGEAIKRELSTSLSRDIAEPQIQKLSITISEVRVSPDLKVAKVYYLPMIKSELPEEILTKLLNQLMYRVKPLITKRLGLKFCPDLRFVYDTSFDSANLISQRIRSELKD